MRKALAGLCLVLLAGCHHSTSTDPGTPIVIAPATKTAIMDGLRVGGELAADDGLKAWGKNNPAAALEAATAFQANIGVIQTYLHGDGALKPGAEVLVFVKSSLFNKIPIEIKAITSLGLIALDTAVSAPNSPLTQDEADYINAFLDGMNTGCADYIANPAAPQKRLAPAIKNTAKKGDTAELPFMKFRD